MSERIFSRRASILGQRNGTDDLLSSDVGGNHSRGQLDFSELVRMLQRIKLQRNLVSFLKMIDIDRNKPNTD